MMSTYLKPSLEHVPIRVPPLVSSSTLREKVFQEKTIPANIFQYADGLLEIEICL